MSPNLGTQYARSTDPAVIQAVYGQQKARRDFADSLRDWATGHGIDPDSVAIFSSPWSLTFGGLRSAPEGLGRWTKPSKGRYSKPYKNNPIRGELARIRHDPPTIPGVEDVFYAEAHPGTRGGGGWFMAAYPFIWEGVAWVCLPHPPTEGRFGDQWEEVRASDALRAREEWQAHKHTKEHGNA